MDLRHIVCLALVYAAGCEPPPQVRKYEVDKPELVDPTLTAAAAAAPQAPASKTQQMLGVIVPIGEESWFFKLAGDPAAVEPARGTFLDFVKSVKFSAGTSPQPSWKLPEGWKDLPPKQFGFATLGFESSGQAVEITVSSARGDVLSNVNRWHGLLGLAPISEQDLPSKTETIMVDGRTGTFISLVGTSSSKGGPPFAPFAGGPKTKAPIGPRVESPASTARASAGGLSYEVPPQWSPAANDPVSSVAFQATDGGKQVKITISAVGGELLSNVNRWRTQVSLPPTTADGLAPSVAKVNTLGGQGDYVELIGPTETILGVRADAGGQTWFIKLRGNSTLAAREKSRFEAFVKSVKLK
jgi:hypothetical protein